MKNKKLLLVICALFLFSFAFIGAEPKGMDNKSPVVIGEVLNIEKSKDKKEIKITVEGYIKDKEVRKLKIVGIVDDNTKIMNSKNDKKENIELQKGDLVYMRVSEKMTKSEPAQTVVKRLFVTQNK